MTEKILALLESQSFDFGDFEDNKEGLIQLLVNEDELNLIELSADSDEDYFEFQGSEFRVLTEDEANEAYEVSMKDSIEDMGVQLFSLSFQETILSNHTDLDFLYDWMKDSYESYANDIENESASDYSYENRLEEEMAEKGYSDKDDFIEYLCEQWEDGAEWYKFNFGEELFKETIQNNADVDWDAVIEECKEEDGRGHTLASYDGDELEEDINGETYYIYRTN